MEATVIAAMLAVVTCAAIFAIVLAFRKDEERRSLVLILAFALCVVGIATAIGAL
jgi:hypothetical protein